MKSLIWLLFLLLISPAIHSQDLTNGLVAYYEFNGNANDQSGYNHHGTVVGASLDTDRFGALNESYNFDGNDYIYVPHSADLNFSVKDFSLSMWVKTSYSNIQMLMQKGGNLGPDGPQYWVRHNDPAMDLLRYVTGDGNPPSSHATTSSITLGDGNWHHIASLRRGNNLEIYYDGCLEAVTKAPSLRNVDSDIQLIIGAQNDWNNKGIHNQFVGLLDAIRIYNRALTTDEILILAEKKVLYAVNAGMDAETCQPDAILAAVPVQDGVGTWKVLNGQATVNDINSPNSMVTNLSLGLNTFEWTVSHGCESLADTVEITRDPQVGAANAGPDQQICNSNVARFQASPPTNGTGRWSVEQGTAVISDPQNPTAQVSRLSQGINTFRWTISNSCSSTFDEVSIYVLESNGNDCGTTLYFHNAFYPASNIPENQSFYLHNPETVEELEIFIFDKWGELVFHKTDAHFSWTGYYKGAICPSGQYSYKVKYRLRNEQGFEETIGSVYLLF